MDSFTSLLQTAACTSRLLRRMDQLMSWARMKIKPSKSRSLSLRRGVRNNSTIFVLEKITLLHEQPIKSLGRQYTTELSDKQMGRTAMKPLSGGLARIDQSQLPGKYKVWCYQLSLYRRVMWPLKMSNIPSSTASRMDGSHSTHSSECDWGCHGAFLKLALGRTLCSCHCSPSVWATCKRRPGLLLR